MNMLDQPPPPPRHTLNESDVKHSMQLILGVCAFELAYDFSITKLIEIR